MDFNDPIQVKRFFETAAAEHDCVLTKFDWANKQFEFNGVDQEGLARTLEEMLPWEVQ